jgi:hypothetical protein
MAPPNAQRVLVEQGGSIAAPTLLGQGPARIPTGGKIRAGIKVLTRKAAESPRRGRSTSRAWRAGQSFDQIEQALAEALPRPEDAAGAAQRASGSPCARRTSPTRRSRADSRSLRRGPGEGGRLYRFPVVFPSDHWQTVMPHELAAWGTHEKRYWSEYSPDGRVRHCMTHAPVPVDDTGGAPSASSAGARR